MIYKRVKIDLFFGSRDPLIKAFTVFFVQPPPSSITNAAALDKNASKHLSFYYCATFPHIHFGYLKKLIRIHHVKKFYGSMMRKIISDFLDKSTLWFLARKFLVSYSMILGAKIQMQWAMWGGDQFFPGIFSTALFLWPQGFPEIPRNALWKKKENSICILSLKMRQE